MITKYNIKVTPDELVVILCSIRTHAHCVEKHGEKHIAGWRAFFKEHNGEMDKLSLSSEAMAYLANLLAWIVQMDAIPPRDMPACMSLTAKIKAEHDRLQAANNN